MPNYRRVLLPGGTYFFTVATNSRRPILTDTPARKALRSAFKEVIGSRPARVEAIVLLPDHLHCVWTLPSDDADYSTRWRLIKDKFTKSYRASGGPETGRSDSRKRKGERGIWQRRFWEHVIQDDDEFQRVCDYIHYNPVKHGYAECPHLWLYSSFHRYVRNRVYSRDWACGCTGQYEPGPELLDLVWSGGEP